MRKPERARSKLRDDISHPGIGLFSDERADRSTERAYARVAELGGDNGQSIVHEQLRERLSEAARHYWADRDYDDRTTNLELRQEIRPLHDALTTAAERLDALSPPSRAALLNEAHKTTRGAESELLNEFAALVTRMRTNVMTAQTEMLVPKKRFCASSNGDTWDLVSDGEQVFVLHRPNLASGGMPKHIELGAFLMHEPHTAQNVALVRLIGTLATEEGSTKSRKADAQAERDGQAIAQGAGMNTME